MIGHAPRALYLLVEKIQAERVDTLLAIRALKPGAPVPNPPKPSDWRCPRALIPRWNETNSHPTSLI